MRARTCMSMWVCAGACGELTKRRLNRLSAFEPSVGLSVCLSVFPPVRTPAFLCILAYWFYTVFMCAHVSVCFCMSICPSVCLPACMHQCALQIVMCRACVCLCSCVCGVCLFLCVHQCLLILLSPCAVHVHHALTPACMYACLYVCVCVYTYNMYVCIYECMYVHVCVYNIHICKSLHIFIHTSYTYVRTNTHIRIFQDLVLFTHACWHSLQSPRSRMPSL